MSGGMSGGAPLLGTTVPAPRRSTWPPGVLLAAAVLALLVLAALFPGLLTGRHPSDTDIGGALLGPGTAHPFGTDELGRDVLARVVYGARPSLTIGLGATALGAALGIPIGLLAAVGGRLLDQVLMRCLEVLLALPELLLALLVVTVVGAGTGNVLVAIGVAAVPNYARLIRAQALVALGSEYVEAAVGLGRGRVHIALRHVLPNVLGPLLVLATIGSGTAIVSGSALSFLGLGPAPPSPEWGGMLSDARDHLGTAWWTGVFPGLAVVAVVLSVTVLGRRLRARGEGGGR
jgi:peptide/nickel transport system permease protein